MSKLAAQLKSRLDSLKSARSNWETHWEELARYVVPRKDDVISKVVPGEKKGIETFDTTGIHSNELLAGALHGMLTNPTAPWFSLTTGDSELDSDDEIRRFLQDAVERMNLVMNASNFQTEIHEIYLDLGAFGTAAMEIVEDDDFVVRFHTRAIAEVFIEESNRGLVDALYRQFEWGAREIVMEFGEDSVPVSIKRAIEIDSQDKFSIIHSVFPINRLGDAEKRRLKLKGSKKFASVYQMEENDQILRVGGFNEFPYVVPRWTKISGEIYGRSPSMKALPDIKMINQMMKTTLKGAQKVVDPPIALPDDGFILPITTKPGGINYYRAGTADKVDLFANNARIDFGFQLIETIKKQIRQNYFVDQLQLGTEGPQMTATEVAQRNEERLRLMGPILGRQQVELLAPLVDRVFAIMTRRGMFEFPEILEGRELQVKYSSLFAKAQKATDGQNILRTIETAAPFISADPGVLDNINGDEAIRFISQIYDMPQQILRDKDDVEELRQQRAEAQAQAEQQAQNSAVAEQIGKAGPGLAKLRESA